MKKDVFKLLLEIFVVTIILTFSFPSWQNINAATKNVDEIVASVEPGLEVYELSINNIEVLNDTSDFKHNNIVVNNSTSIGRSGKLLLMYSKLSTLNYNDLIITVNDKSQDLSSLLKTSNKNYYVFELEEVTLAKYNSKEYLISYNIKENTLFENVIGKYFDSNIEILEINL